MHHPEFAPAPDIIEQFVLDADINTLLCVDERQLSEGSPPDAKNGVEVPGAIYGILDMIKSLTGVNEDEARKIVIRSGIPIAAHVDDHHHGQKGCGYAGKVETDPESVLASESITEENRLQWVQQHGGTVMEYTGVHNPSYAVINFRPEKSIDSDQAMARGIGIFNFDGWVIQEYVNRINENNSDIFIDPDKATEHMIKVFVSTVQNLSSIRSFHQLA